MNVCIDFPHVVKVPVRHALRVGHLLVLVEEEVQVPLALEVGQAAEGEGLAGTVGADVENLFEVHVVLLYGGDSDDGDVRVEGYIALAITTLIT